jgi:hypothetical protein
VTYAPASLKNLAAFWESNGGVNLGIVGNQRHCQGFHLGRDRIFGACACRPGPSGSCVAGKGWADYSVRTGRDRNGLTDAASAIDLGRLEGTLADLYAFSRWLVGRARANAAGTSDLREIIYSPDGQRVLGWSREAGVDSAPIPGYGDASHLTHTHISFYRDSQARDKRPLFAPYFTQVPDTATGDDMTVKATAKGTTVSGVLRVATDTLVIPTEGLVRLDISQGAVRHALGPYTLDDLPDWGDTYLVTEEGRPGYIRADRVTFTRNDGASSTPSVAYPVTVGGKSAGSVTLP